MKSIVMPFLMSAFGVIFGVFVASSLPTAQAEAGNKDTIIHGDLVVTGIIKSDSVQARSLSAINGDASVLINASNSASGVWVRRSDSSPMASLYVGQKHEGAVLGLGGPSFQMGGSHGGYDMAIYVDKNFHPQCKVNHGNGEYGIKHLSELFPIINGNDE